MSTSEFPIPQRKCFRCGGLTNQTHSVLGVMHTSCFQAIHAPTAIHVISKVIQGLAEVRAGTRTVDDLEAQLMVGGQHKISQSA